MDTVIRRVEIQYDDLALARNGLHTLLENQCLDFLRMRLDLARFGELLHAEFKTVERALAGQRFSLVFFMAPLLAKHVGTTANRRQQGIVPEAIMIVDIFVAQRDADDALA